MSNVDVLIEGVGKVRVPKGYNWIARDHDGSWWAYRDRPRANPDRGHWDTPTLEPARLTDGDTMVPDWRETLRRVGADEVCPECRGNGQTPDAGVAFGAPVICHECLGSGLAEDSITANESAPPRQEASGLSRSLKLTPAEEQAEAWQAVCALLSELRPGWTVGPGTGQELALAAIRHGLATPPQQASAPVGVELPEGFALNLSVAEATLRKLVAVCPVTPPEAAAIRSVIAGARALAGQQPAAVGEVLTPTGTFCSVCEAPQHNTPSGVSCPRGHGGAEPLAAQPAADRFAATFRCESNGIVGTTNAPIHSVTMHDDGVVEVVIDHWPEQPAAVDEVMERVRRGPARLWQADLVGGQISVERMREILAFALAGQLHGGRDDG